MLNEEIDEICCKFAGIKDNSDMPHMFGAKSSYPAVSTDPNAMWKLMEALRKRVVRCSIDCMDCVGNPYQGSILWGSRGIQKTAATPMMALALAVVEAAKRAGVTP